jgi:hypothetical protein
MRFALCSLLMIPLTVGCGGGEQKPAAEPVDDPTDEPLTLPVPDNGYQLATPVYEVPAFSEIEICTVMRLEQKEDEKLYWVNSLESLVTEGTHHMNVLIGEFSFLDAFVGDGTSEAALGADIGQHLCSEIDTMERAYTIFPSQRDNQRITLPEGVAAPMTAPLLLVFSHHYVNASDASVSIGAVLNIETIGVEEVTHVAGLLFDDIPDFEVPAGTDRVASRTCVVERDVEVALVSSHNHQWGECATMNHYASASETVEPEPFFVNKAWEQPPILHFEPGSFSVSAGDGVHWACHYRNDTDRTLVNDGTAEGEMCVFAAVIYPSLWTVEQVEEVVANENLSELVTLMGDVMGPCDSVIETVESPWATDDAGACESLEQTESNVLD